MRILFVLLTLFCLGAQVTAARPLDLTLTAGFNGVMSNDALLKNNKGAELGAIASLPLTFWREDANLVTLRAQYTSYANGIETPSPANAATLVKLTNAGHAQLRADFRQIFALWGIEFSAGLGIQVPLTTSLLAPRGELTFTEAKSTYAAAAPEIQKIDSAYAGYVRLGIDQRVLADSVLLGIALEINFVESIKTEQRAVLNFYAGAKIF